MVNKLKRMMISVGLLASALGSTAAAEPEQRSESADAKPAASPATFPVPKDAGAPSAAPGGDGKIQLYKVPRGRDAVVAEVREALKTGGWTVTKDTASPSGNAIRLEVKKGEIVIMARFTGDANQTAIILTLP